MLIFLITIWRKGPQWKRKQERISNSQLDKEDTNKCEFERDIFFGEDESGSEVIAEPEPQNEAEALKELSHSLDLHTKFNRIPLRARFFSICAILPSFLKSPVFSTPTSVNFYRKRNRERLQFAYVEFAFTDDLKWSSSVDIKKHTIKDIKRTMKWNQYYCGDSGDGQDSSNTYHISKDKYSETS